MKVGDLIQYRTSYGTSALGIVMEDMGFFKEYNEEAVRVYWFDSHACSEEKTRELLDPHCEHYEVISESR